MVGIWELDNVALIEEYVNNVFLKAVVDVSEQERSEASLVNELNLEIILVYGTWGEGTAEINEDTIQTALFFSFDGLDDAFVDVSEAVSEQMSLLVQEGEIPPPEPIVQNTAGITFTPASISDFNNVLAQMSQGDLELVFELTELQAIDLIQGRPPDQYPRIPVEELTDDKEELEDVEVDDKTPDIPDMAITDAPQLPEDILLDLAQEDIGPEFPSISEELRPFAVSEDTLEIPAGKEEKQIEMREPFNFEQEMALPGLQTDSSTLQRTIEEIARPVGAGTLGSEEPVGTYPRTGLYVRNYLEFKGPAYSYEIYKNLIYYSGYISTVHDINVRAGSYQSFRDYMYVLVETPERGGPELVEELTPEEAASQELDIVPDHPTIDGEKAPWLERRQYYRLVDNTSNSDVWNNPYDYLYEET